LTRDRATPRQARQLGVLHGNPLLDEEGATVLRGIISSTGALRTVEEMITERTHRAVHALDRAPITDDARIALNDLARAATVRAA